MPKSNPRLLLLLVLFVGACASPADDGAAEQGPDPSAPEPIGPALIRLEVGTVAPCSSRILYRQGPELQSQCFDEDGEFSYENRGTLTPETAATLDVELAAADLGDTEPVSYQGSCGLPDSFGTETLWIGDQSISFELNCLIRGIVPLYEHVDAIWTALRHCGQVNGELLESVEPGCQL